MKRKIVPFSLLLKNFIESFISGDVNGFGLLYDEKGIYGYGFGKYIGETYIDNEKFFIVDGSVKKFIYRKDILGKQKFSYSNDFIDGRNLHLYLKAMFKKDFQAKCVPFYVANNFLRMSNKIHNNLFEICEINKEQYNYKSSNFLFHKNFNKFAYCTYRKILDLMLKHVVDKDFKNKINKLPFQYMSTGYYILCSDFVNNIENKTIQELYYTIKTLYYGCNTDTSFITHIRHFFDNKDNKKIEHIFKDRKVFLEYNKYINTIPIHILLFMVSSSKEYALSFYSITNNSNLKKVFFEYFEKIKNEKNISLVLLCAMLNMIEKNKDVSIHFLENRKEYERYRNHLFILHYFENIIDIKSVKTFSVRTLEKHYKKIYSNVNIETFHSKNDIIKTLVMLTKIFGLYFYQFVHTTPKLAYTIAYQLFIQKDKNDVSKKYLCDILNQILSGQKIKNIVNKVFLDVKKDPSIDINILVYMLDSCYNNFRGNLFTNGVFLERYKILFSKHFFDLIKDFDLDTIQYIYKEIIHTIHEFHDFENKSLINYISFFVKSLKKINLKEKYNKSADFERDCGCIRDWYYSIYKNNDRFIDTNMSFEYALKLSNDWHEEILFIQATPEVIINHQNWIENYQDNDVIITRLYKKTEFLRESNRMHNCVSSYFERSYKNELQIYHCEFKEEKATLEIRQDENNKIYRQQFMGVYNKKVSKDFELFIDNFIEKHNNFYLIESYDTLLDSIEITDINNIKETKKTSVFVKIIDKFKSILYKKS